MLLLQSPLTLTLDGERGLTGDLSKFILNSEHVLAGVLDPNIDDDQYNSFSFLYDMCTLRGLNLNAVDVPDDSGHRY